MAKIIKLMVVVMVLALMAWGSVAARADDNPGQFWTLGTSFERACSLARTLRL